MSRVSRRRYARSATWLVAAVGLLATIVSVSGLAAALLTGSTSTSTAAGPRVSGSQVEQLTQEAATTSTGSVSASAAAYGLTDAPAQSWLDEVSARTGIPRRALAAYGASSLRMERDDPSCHLGWATLAGIGAVESDHGTDGGSTLRDDGTTTLVIRGPALDGTNGTAAIRATAETTARHGDPTWDRAVGPLQFIGSTWKTWGSDGDGNGTADPNDIDDAAWTAARYLCASGGDLATGTGWSAAVYSYNHSADYVNAVLGYAVRYAG